MASPSEVARLKRQGSKGNATGSEAYDSETLRAKKLAAILAGGHEAAAAEISIAASSPSSSWDPNASIRLSASEVKAIGLDTMKAQAQQQSGASPGPTPMESTRKPAANARRQRRDPRNERIVAIEFENKYSTHKNIKSEQVRSFLMYPEVDITLEREEKTYRTDVPSVPRREQEKAMPLHIQECIYSFTANLSYLKFHNRQYGGAVAVTPPATPLDLPHQNFDIDIDDELAIEREKSVQVELDSDLLAEYTEEMKLNELKERQQNRYRIFNLIPPENVLPASDKRDHTASQTLRSYTEAPKIQYWLNIKEFGTARTMVEPFYICASLYDMKEQRKASEDFWVDVNNNSLREMIKGRPSPAGVSTAGTQALFSINAPSADLYLVIRVEKILMGEHEPATEMYMKSVAKPKDATKYQIGMEGACERLGKFTQAFGMTAISLFGPDGKPKYSTTQKETLEKIVRVPDLTDETLFKNFKAMTASKKDSTKVYPELRLTLEVGISKDQLPGVVTPSLTVVKPKIDPPQPSLVVREIQEFTPSEYISTPKAEWVNLLYVYPESVNMNTFSGKGSARNLSLSFKYKLDDSNINKPGEPVFFGRCRMPDYVEEAVTSVQYHKPRPGFHEEIKVRLPSVMNPSHHLLITINHINCKPPKEQKKKSTGKSVLPLDFSAESAVGWSVLPLLYGEDNKLIANGEHSLPVALQTPIEKYNDPAKEEKEVKWLDKKKPNLVLKTQLISTIYCKEKRIEEFFFRYDTDAAEMYLIQALVDLQELEQKYCVEWMPILLNLLIKTVVNKKGKMGAAALRAILHIVHQVTLLDFPDWKPTPASELMEGQKPEIGPMPIAEHRNKYLLSYVTFHFENFPGCRNPVFLDIFGMWVKYLNAKDEDLELFHRYSWFLFSLGFKSMTLWLDANKQLAQDLSGEVEMKPRNKRFPDSVSDLLWSIIMKLADHVSLMGRESLAKCLNAEVAFFLKDLFAIYDRGAVMDLAALYMDTVSTVDHVFNVLWVLCDYENYVQLNLPLPDKIESINTMDIVFSTNHFLSSLLINEVAKTLNKYAICKGQSAGPGAAGARNKALNILYYIMMKHDSDARYNSLLNQRCIAGCYFLWIVQLIDGQNRQQWVTLAPRKERKKLLITFLWVIVGVTRRLLQQWWKLETQKRVITFFVMLANCIGTFEYGESSSENTDKQTEQASAVDLKAQAKVVADVSALEAALTDDPMGLKKSSEANSLRAFKRKQHLTTMTKKGIDKYIREGNLSREIAMVTLDLLMDFMDDFRDDISRPGSIYMDRLVMGILLLLLKKNQAVSSMASVFAAVRHVIVNFTHPLFIHVTPFCGDLTYEILRHCNSPTVSIRNKAAALLYLMLKTNYGTCGNFSRTKLQATIGVSKLLGEGQADSITRFRAVFHTIAECAKQDAYMKDKDFANKCSELMERLYIVLQNSLKMKQFKHDPEMMADLYYQISKGYMASPDLRATWLQCLSTLHIENENWEEAAQCRVHTASLISVYINELKQKERVIVNKRQFRRVAPNIDSEMDVPAEAFEEEGICQSTTFTRSGLFSQLADAVSFLKKISLYESCVALERMMAEIYRANRTFTELPALFEDLNQLCLKIAQDTGRLYSNYYLVGFYGSGWGDMNDVQYIYKEPASVRLADISNRLQTQFQTKFGEHLYITGPRFDPQKPQEALKGKVDANPVFLQVLSVSPYFSAQELHTRPSSFERNFDLQRFIYETAVTKSGKSYSDDIREQGKLKTILTTELPFPYVIKRLRVTHKENVELTPIQTSTELIEDRNDKLESELSAKPPNPKTLQIVLQGSVLLQVNAGPLAICNTFLGEPHLYSSEDIARLRKAMKQFINLCGKAVKLNKTLIGADQVAFQEQLVKGYQSARETISKLVDLS